MVRGVPDRICMVVKVLLEEVHMALTASTEDRSLTTLVQVPQHLDCRREHEEYLAPMEPAAVEKQDPFQPHLHSRSLGIFSVLKLDTAVLSPAPRVRL